jgi:superoxide dismutase, Fe-Mn family
MKSKLIAATLVILTFAAFEPVLNAQTGFKPKAFYTYDASGNRTGFAFPSLPYAYDALQPSIDSLTVSIHYDKHHRAYFTKFVAAAKENNLNGKSLEEIFASSSKYPESIRDFGGGLYNHTLYWENMGPSKGGKPSGALAMAIDKKFGSFEKFKELFGNAAKSKFGSGWAWLILDSKMELQVTTTSNQDNPLMDVVDQKGIPLLALDVWEHAYYLKYQNKRGDYVDAFWNIINWDEVSRRYKEGLGNR